MAKTPTTEQQKHIERALQKYNRGIFVRELRRQAHRQTTGTLRREQSKVCAIGLLTELYLLHTGRPVLRDWSTLVEPALHWIGYTSIQGSAVIHMNDSGKSFPAIADAIERGTVPVVRSGPQPFPVTFSDF